MKAHPKLILAASSFALALAPALSPAALITFESDQGYTVDTNLATTTAGAINKQFNGTNGWSQSTSSGAGRIIATTTSGEYVGGQALTGASGAATYIGANKTAGVIEYTGMNTITFDARYATGIGVGFMNDDDGDGLYDQGSGGANGDSGMSFGVGGSPVRFQSRNADFGGENFGANFAGTVGNWYHFAIEIGESIAGSRAISMGVRDLTTATDYDFDTITEGIQPWNFSVTDAQFGAAPETATGIYVRITTGASIDNLRFTAVPEPSAALLGGLGLLALLRRRR